MRWMESCFGNRSRGENPRRLRTGVLSTLVVAAAFPVCGCVSQNRLAYERALFAREYRILEDELYLAREDLAYLARVNETLLRQVGGDGGASDDTGDEHGGVKRSVRPTAAPKFEPLIDEDAIPSQERHTEDIDGDYELEDAPEYESRYERYESEHRGMSANRVSKNEGGAGDPFIPELAPRPIKPVGHAEIQDHTSVEEERILLWAPRR